MSAETGKDLCPVCRTEMDYRPDEGCFYCVECVRTRDEVYVPPLSVELVTPMQQIRGLLSDVELPESLDQALGRACSRHRGRSEAHHAEGGLIR